MNETSLQKTIYIADDERNIRELIKRFLISAGYRVEAFESGDSLLSHFKLTPCDLVILDITMPGTDGLSICEQLRAISPVPIVIVSARDSEMDRITGITLGSDDYMVKPFSPSELVARVHALFRRSNLNQNPGMLATQNSAHHCFGDLVIEDKQRAIRYSGGQLEVSPTEYDFLKYLFEHQDRAVSREELLKHVWQFDCDVDTRATDDVVKRLRKKLAVTRVRLVAVWGFGFKLAVEPEV